MVERYSKMPVIGPGSPSKSEVDEALNSVLELLKNTYGCLKYPPPKWPNVQELRTERINKLRDALYDMIELEYWEGF